MWRASIGAVTAKLGFGILHRVVGSCSQNKHSASLSSGKGGKASMKEYRQSCSCFLVNLHKLR